MIKFRICQNCGVRVDSPTAFFCAHCGNLLEKKAPPASRPDIEPSAGKSPEAAKIKFSHRPALFVWVLVFLVFTLAALVFLFWGQLTGKVESGAAGVLLANFHFNADNEVMEKPFFSEGVPDKVDFYLSGKQSAAFFEKIIKADFLRLFEKTVGLNLQEAASYLELGFAFFGEGDSFAFLAKGKAPDFLEKKVKEVNESSPRLSYRPYLYGTYLLVTDSEKLAADVKEVLEKKRLNLSLKASFAEGWRLSPHRGQYFLYAANRTALQKVWPLLFGPTSGPFLPDKIKGQVVLLSGGEEGTYLRGGIYGE